MDKIDKDLLQNYLTNKGNDEDMAIVEDWLNQDVDLSCMPADSQNDTGRRCVDREDVWSTIQGAIRQAEGRTLRSKRNIRIKQIATLKRIAAVACVFGLVWIGKAVFPLQGLLFTADAGASSKYQVKDGPYNFTYEIDGDIEYADMDGSTIFKNVDDFDITLKINSGKRRVGSSTHYSLKKGESYIVIFVGNDPFLNSCNDVLVLPLKELNSVPPHEAIRGVLDKLKNTKCSC